MIISNAKIYRFCGSDFAAAKQFRYLQVHIYLHSNLNSNVLIDYVLKTTWMKLGSFEKKHHPALNCNIRQAYSYS